MRQSPDRRNIAHLVFHISTIEDVIHSFSPKGYELLTDEFISFLENLKPVIKLSQPILMELVGANLTRQEQESVERAIRTHYGLRVSEHRTVLKKCLFKIIWFLISFIASSLLLFFTSGKEQELFIQFAYLPFWFFGYRLLTYPLFEYLPQLREKRRNEQLSSMRVIFSNEVAGSETIEEQELTFAKTKENLSKVRELIKHNKLVSEYFMDLDTVELECVVNEESRLFAKGSMEGKGFISDELAAYMEQAVPFIKRNQKVRLDVTGAQLSEDSQTGLKEALSSYFDLRIRQIKAERITNTKNIILLFAGLLAASILLIIIGQSVNIAYHEFILILLWFSGDYLIEFLVITQTQIYNKMCKWKTFAGMSVNFRQSK